MNPSGANKRRHPRIRVELPVQARVDQANAVILQLADISAQGMQLRMKSSEFESLRKAASAKDQHNSFEIQLTARLAWVMPNEDGTFTTGWEFNLLDDEQRIG
jgi:hypothetical protein